MPDEQDDDIEEIIAEFYEAALQAKQQRMSDQALKQWSEQGIRVGNA